MSQLISVGRQFYRINPTKNSIEVSNDGRYWSSKCTSSAYGIFKDLCLFGREIYAVTTNGVYSSQDNGRTWQWRRDGLSGVECQALMVSGSELYVQTSRGFYVSKNGRNFQRK